MESKAYSGLARKPGPQDIAYRAGKFSSLASMAAGAAALGSPAAASTVQITLVDNFFSSNADSLDADLTGNMAIDLPGLNGNFTSRVLSTNTYLGFTSKQRYYGVAVISTSFRRIGAAAFQKSTFNGVPGSANGYRATVGTMYSKGPGLLDRQDLIPVPFTDSRINNGAETNGLLEVRAFNSSKTEHTVQLLRLVFDDASTAEPSGVVAGGTKPEFASVEDPTDDLVDAFVNSTSEAEKRAIVAKLKKLKNGIKKLKKKLRGASGSKRIIILKKIKKLKKVEKKYKGAHTGLGGGQRG